MADPFAILAQNRFSIPDLISQDMGMKRQRLEDLYRQRQIQKEDREFERQNKRDSVLARLVTKGGGQTSGSAGGSPAPTGVSSPQAPTRPDAASIPSGSPLSPETLPDQPGVGGPVEAAAPITGASSAPTLNQEALGELMAIDPTMALQLQKHFAEADEATRKAAEGKYAVLGSVAMHLTSFPPTARRQALQQIAPRLLAAGWTPEELNQADLSDAGLQGYAAVSMDVKTILSQRRDDAQFEETKRHNRAGEANAAAGLGIRREALNVARDREKRVAAGKGGSDLSNATTDALLSAAGL